MIKKSIFHLPTSIFQRSYTLVELLIFMGMFSILLVVMTNIFSQIMDVRRESESVSSVEQDGNYILNRLNYDISRASGINIPIAVGTTDTVLDITIDSSNYVYALNNENIQLTANGQNYQLNGTNNSISNLSFKRIGNDDNKDTVQLSYTVTSRIQQASGFETKNYQTTIGLR